MKVKARARIKKGKKHYKSVVNVLSFHEYLFLIEKVLNFFLKNGKKHNAENFFLNVLKILKKENRFKNPINIIYLSILNVSPLFFIKNRRFGKNKILLIPRPILSNNLRIFLGLKLIMKSCFLRKEKKIYEKFAYEILDAFKNTGHSKEEQIRTHKIVLSKKSFINFRW